MAFTIPSIEPAELRAGVTWKWTRSWADYPKTSGSWTLIYYFRLTSGSGFTITAGADPLNSEGFLVNVDEATTAGYTVGTYAWEARVNNGSDYHIADYGNMKVLANLAVVSTVDNRSDAKIIYDALIVMAKERATRPEASYSMEAAGRSFTFKSDREIHEAINYWGAIVRNEQALDNVRKGKASGKNILVRF